MVRKKFIDKRSATTYSLVYRSTDGADDDDGAAALALAEGEGGGAVLALADGADRMLVAQRPPAAAPQGGGAGPGPQGGPPPPAQDPRALYRHFFGGADEEDDGGGGGGSGGRLLDARRLELLSLGFPDDGYDYLKHMRVVGGGGGAGQRHKQQEQDERQDGGASRPLPATAAVPAPPPAAVRAPSAPSAAAANAAADAAEAGGEIVETVGPATFLRAPRLRAPAPDVRLVDARGVGAPPPPPAGAGGLEAEMRALGLGLGGAARPQLPSRGALAAELAEVEAAMAAEEEEDDEADMLAAEKEAEEAGGDGRLAVAELRGDAGRPGGRRAPAPRPTPVLEGRGDLEDDFLAVANAPARSRGGGRTDDLPKPAAAPAPRAPPAMVVGFDAPSDDREEEEEEEEGGERQGERRPLHRHGRAAATAAQGGGARPTDAVPSDAVAYAELNSQFERLMEAEYDDDDEDEEEDEDGDDEDADDGDGREPRRRRRRAPGGARTVAEELTPARLAALLSGGVGGDEAPFDGGDDAYFDDEADGYGGGSVYGGGGGDDGDGDDDDDKRERQRREKLRRARAEALAELEGCAPVVPNAARVATLDDRDEASLAATRARVAAAPRLGGDDEVDDKGRVLGGAGDVGQGDEPLETLHMRRVRDRWDCESVLSLRTTASFQPSRIGDGLGPGGRRPRSLATPPAEGAGGGGPGAIIRLSQRTGLPSGHGGARAGGQLEGGALLAEVAEEGEEGDAMDEDEDEEEDEGDAGAGRASRPRPRDETPEEKRARKGAAKAAQRAAREQKRQLKAAFREEAGRQGRQRAAVGAGSGASTFAIP